MKTFLIAVRVIKVILMYVLLGCFISILYKMVDHNIVYKLITLMLNINTKYEIHMQNVQNTKYTL